MPYRAMFSTIITVALALLALGMWVRAIEPLLAGAQATDAVATAPAIRPTTSPASEPAESTKVQRLAQGTLLLAFLLICLLLVVGFAATFREWVRFKTREPRRGRRQRTPYVDAWKIAGERMHVEGEDEGPEEPGAEPEEDEE